MATDPSQLIANLLQSPNAIAQSYEQGQDQATQRQAMQQQTAARAYQLQAVQQAAQAEQQQAQAYQQDVAAYVSDPHPQRLAALVAKYPQQAEALQKSYSILDAPARESRVTQLSQMFNAAKNGRADLATQQIDGVIAAEKSQGIDTSEAEQIKAGLASGDPAALTRLQAFAQAHLAAADPEFAKSIGVTGDSGAHFHSSDEGIFDDRTGEVKTAAREKPEYRTIKNADGSESIVQVGGGGQASGVAGGGSTAGNVRTVGGWTPRARNGGDNSDAAVDNKIAGVASALGVDPDADISSLSPAQIAKALAYGEGGAGSLADRNNNGANLRDGKDLSYRKFATKDAGVAAAAAQVSRNLKRGQTSVRTMIEGLPVGGGKPRITGSGAQVIYTSKPAPSAGAGANALSDDTISDMADQYLAGDKTVFTNLGRGTQGATDIRRLRNAVATRARAAGMSGGDIAAQMADMAGTMAASRAAGTRIAQVDLAATEAEKIIPLALAASDALPRNGFLPFAKAQQALRANTNNPTLRKFVAANNALVNVYARAISPQGGGTVADKEHARDLLNTAYDQDSYRAVVQQMQAEIGAAKAAPRQVRSDIRASVRGATAPHGEAPVRVTSPQQAASLPPGSLFITPDGRRMRKH